VSLLIVYKNEMILDMINICKFAQNLSLNTITNSSNSNNNIDEAKLKDFMGKAFMTLAALGALL
jgi:hypothetical protein